MLKYVLKRLVLFIPVILGVVFLIFFILNLTPSNPGATILGTSATPEEIAAYNAEVGADKPFLIRFGRYVAGIVQGDLGISYAYKTPVTELVFSRLFPTVMLSFSAMVVATVLGISLRPLRWRCHKALSRCGRLPSDGILSDFPSD